MFDPYDNYEGGTESGIDSVYAMAAEAGILWDSPSDLED
jgi:hypothetical protein